MLKAVEAPLAGHPDKVCDFVVESVVDEYLRRDPQSRLDVQALGTNGMIMVGGAVESQADFDVAAVVRTAYATIGYQDEPAIFVNVERPPKFEVNRERKKSGASGTAIVYGYATRETREMLPPAVVYAQTIAQRIDELRRTDAQFSWLKPDGKVQVVMDAGRLTHVTMIVEHDEAVEVPQVQALMFERVIVPACGGAEGVQVLVNPLGPFTQGGFSLNAGVSGRKVLADLYGGLLPHGGVGLVGKDPMKPARAGTYMARFAARQLVQEGLASTALVHVVYTVGLEEPIIVRATAGDGTDLSAIVQERFDFRPAAIVERFNLGRPLYAGCSVYGTFGRADVPWEE